MTTALATRGTTNRNARGGTPARKARREYLVRTYRANVDVRYLFVHHDPSTGEGVWPPATIEVPFGTGIPACRCYRCGDLLTEETLTTDRIVPGCKKTARYPKGGTYVRQNIRPACGKCNSETGGALASRKKP